MRQCRLGWSEWSGRQEPARGSNGSGRKVGHMTLTGRRARRTEGRLGVASCLQRREAMFVAYRASHARQVHDAGNAKCALKPASGISATANEQTHSVSIFAVPSSAPDPHKSAQDLLRPPDRQRRPRRRRYRDKCRLGVAGHSSHPSHHPSFPLPANLLHLARQQDRSFLNHAASSSLLHSGRCHIKH
jgi:hypothetical protein